MSEAKVSRTLSEDHQASGYSGAGTSAYKPYVIVAAQHDNVQLSAIRNGPQKTAGSGYTRLHIGKKLRLYDSFEGMDSICLNRPENELKPALLLEEIEFLV